MKSNEIRARLANQDFEAKQLKQIQEDIRLLHGSVNDLANMVGSAYTVAFYSAPEPIQQKCAATALDTVANAAEIEGRYKARYGELDAS